MKKIITHCFLLLSLFVLSSCGTDGKSSTEKKFLKMVILILHKKNNLKDLVLKLLF